MTLAGATATVTVAGVTTPPMTTPIAVAATARTAAAAPAAGATTSRHPPPTPAEAEASLRDRVRSMFSYNATSLAGHAIGAVVVEAVYASAAPAALRLAWGACFVLVWLLRVAIGLRLPDPATAPLATLLRGRNVWIAGILLSAALWGWAGWSYFPHGEALEQIALIVVVYTFCVACIPIVAPQFRLYLGLVALIDLPVLVRVALVTPGPGLQIAAVLSIAMAMTIVLGRNYRDSFATLCRLRRRNEALVGELRTETAVAEAARGQAETANRAKTQFFAAASHDLRQPLHAMGLFAEALRQRVREPEVAQLVASVNESVDALDGLFSELLDITRIDSGGVTVQPRAFEIGELLRRIRLHFEPAAFDKGLALRLRGAGCVVFADPLLVERILRNLVSNAIRYTDDGTVLVSCRRRGGRALLQVWDTGAGIPPDQQRRIFDEFYQLPGRPQASPEQKKGLGLGLAIVDRLAALMGVPLTLRSAPGRGTVFTLELPPGEAADTAVADIAAPPSAAATTLQGRFIVVVEDDPAVRAGLAALLAGWGARVRTFERVAAVVAWANGVEAERPDVAIVDHGLGDGTTGLEALAALRARFGAGLPAIVATGSVLGGHDQIARAHDLHVLLKPVAPTRLRAMLAFKLSGAG